MFRIVLETAQPWGNMEGIKIYNQVNSAKMFLLKPQICSLMIDIWVKTLNVLGILCWIVHNLTCEKYLVNTENYSQLNQTV